MALKLYNTLGRKKQTFKPIKDKEVGMYTCGPTVYWFAHIGNMRTYIFGDILKRILLYNGFKVKHVMNITDVGHLTSDAEEGEDKMIKALRREGKPITVEAVKEVAKFYTDAFVADLKRVNIILPDVICKATEHIHDMIELIKRIEKNGYTYETGVGLIYDTSKFKNYAKLGNLNLEQLKAGARVEPDPGRRNPSDFALWLTNQPNQLMQWDSPWGRGFPGWHIECSAMSIKYLGESFDIHCGGEEHIPVHHTNEIAQSEAATGKKWVNYWLHARWLLFKGGKMAKSSGEILTVSELEKKGYSPMVYRYFTLTAHYRTQLDFTDDNIEAAKNAHERLVNRIIELRKENTSKGDIKGYKTKFLEFINNDLDMPEALSLMWQMLKDEKLGAKEKLELAYDFDKVFGLGLKEIHEEKAPEAITKLVKEREEARKKKDFKKGDKLREEIRKLGWEVKDTEEGQKLSKTV
jgi:cysteinyl-tRNA synthetase